MKSAFDEISNKKSSEVHEDVDEFLDRLNKRLIFASPYRFALDYAGNGLTYDKSVANLSRAIGGAIELS